MMQSHTWQNDADPYPAGTMMRMRIRPAQDADPNPAQGCGSLSGTIMRIRIKQNDADPYQVRTMMRIRIRPNNDAD
jgi:hypothetical protein